MLGIVTVCWACLCLCEVLLPEEEFEAETVPSKHKDESLALVFDSI